VRILGRLYLHPSAAIVDAPGGHEYAQSMLVHRQDEDGSAQDAADGSLELVQEDDGSAQDAADGSPERVAAMKEEKFIRVVRGGRPESAQAARCDKQRHRHYEGNL
jgi:hypothetical protein